MEDHRFIVFITVSFFTLSRAVPAAPSSTPTRSARDCTKRRANYSAGRCWIDRRKVTIESIRIAASASAFCRRNTSPQTGIERSP